jgi:dihydroorotate dehydrogenase (NAD+) catalytic subunit
VASGTFGYAEEFKDRMDLKALGGIIVKSLTLEPRGGNKPARIAETPSGMLNSIGLQNVGVDAFIADKLPFLRTLDVPIFANVAGTTMDDYEEVCRRLANAGGIDAVELNISCPNVKKGGMEFGVDPGLAEEVTRRCKVAFGGPLIVKLSPNVIDITGIAKAAQAGGANGVTAINTVLGMAMDAKARRPVLTAVFGGLSGPAIKPVALRCVWQVAKAVNLPILGTGGIRSGEDAAEFLLAGATAVAVGTANFVDPAAAIRVTNELRVWLREQGVAAARDLIKAAHA